MVATIEQRTDEINQFCAPRLRRELSRRCPV